MRRHEVALIVPCYNEKETILKVYKRIKKYGKILIVDYCSIDGTPLAPKFRDAVLLYHNTSHVTCIIFGAYPADSPRAVDHHSQGVEMLCARIEPRRANAEPERLIQGGAGAQCGDW